MISTKHENATPERPSSTSPSVMPCGSPIGGKPPCTAPTTATPWAAASVAAETTINSDDRDDRARHLGHEPLEADDDGDRPEREGERRPS